MYVKFFINLYTCRIGELPVAIHDRIPRHDPKGDCIRGVLLYIIQWVNFKNLLNVGEEESYKVFTPGKVTDTI